jgi:hypothetical protein
MSQTFELQQGSKNRYGSWLILLFIVIFGVTLILSWPAVSGSQPALIGHDNTTTTKSAAGKQPIASASNPEVNQLLLLKPLTGRLTQRPDFVSPMEWQVLQGVARQQANSDQVLTRLVNNLRFNKQLTAWRSMPATSQRLQLAQLLLADIPVHVALQELTLDDAKKLQQQLLADIVPDPQQRRQRLEQEGKRLHSLLQ